MKWSRAIAILEEHNFPTMSQFDLLYPRHHSFTKDVLDNTDNANVLANTVSQPGLRCVYIDATNKVQVLAFGTGPVGQDLIAFSLGDKPLSLKPVSFTINLLKRQVLAMAMPTTATDIGIPTIDSKLPDTCHTRASRGQEAANKTQVTLEGLGFPTGGTDVPHFVKIPIILPVPAGEWIPEGHDLTTIKPPPPARLRSDFAPFQHWLDLMHHLISKNNGLSLHAPDSTLIDSEELPASITENWNGVLGVTITPTHIPGNDASYDRIMERLTDKQHTTVCEWATSKNNSPEPSNNNGNPSNTFDTERFATGLAKALNTQKTPDEKKQLSKIQNAKNFWLLFGASRVTLAGDDDFSVQFGEITPEFEAVMTADASSAHRIMQASWTTHLDTIRDDPENVFSSGVTMKPEHFDNITTKTLVHGWFLHHPFHATTNLASELDSNLSLFHFGSIHGGNNQFSSRVAANIKADQEELADEDTTKRSAKTTKLFWKTNIRTGQHVTEMLANFKAVGTFCLKGFEHSQLWKNIKSFYAVAMGKTGKDWLTTYKHSFQHLPFAIACEFQDIIHHSVVIAQSQRYLQSAANEALHDISHNVIKESAVLTSIAVCEHKSIVQRFKVCGQFTCPPTAWHLFDKKPPNTNQGNSNNNSPSTGGSPPARGSGSPHAGSKRSADGSIKQSNDKNNWQGSGVFFKKVSGPPPPFTKQVKVKGKNARPCQWGCFMNGQKCHHGDRCTFHHIETWYDVDEESRHLLDAYVKSNSDKVEYSKKGKPGNNNTTNTRATDPGQ